MGTVVLGDVFEMMRVKRGLYGNVRYLATWGQQHILFFFNVGSPNHATWKVVKWTSSQTRQDSILHTRHPTTSKEPEECPEIFPRKPLSQATL